LKREMMRDGQISPSQLFLPSGGLPGKTGPPKVALLTGATGFVGAFLLRELMDHMDVVYCLVRASSADAGMGRIKENLIHYSVVKEEEWPSFASKIIPMLGDLGQRNLGLGAAKFEQIAHHVDIVYHNGAMVNMSFGYGTLKAPNVGGTLECLRLATLAGFAIPIHYISTEGVLPACLAECKESPGIIKKKKKKFVSEEYVLSDPDLLHDNGYDQSKWVAENLALDAASRGYPIATYRLGRIGPDSRTGASNTDDFLLLFVKGCLQMKCFPTASTFEFPINMIPANITASRICSISLSDEPASGVYHIGNPDPLDYEIVPRTLHEMGYEFAEVPYQMWRQRLLDAATEDNVLKPLENAFGEGNASLAGTLVDCTRAGIASSPLKPADIKLCFTYMQTQGFLPLP
jgi:thioester reductase-like protein